MSGDLTLQADVHLPGEPVRRNVDVRLVDDGHLRVGERTLALEELLWAERRAGLYLVFSEGGSVALRADPHRLDGLARAVEEGMPGAEQRRRLSSRLEGELQLAAGCAVVGRLSGRTIHGLRVAALTDGGLHLVGSGGIQEFPWPADSAEVVRGRGDRRALRLRRDEDVVALHYLRRDEEDAVRAVATGAGTGGEAGAGSLEMFRQEEVAPPPAAEVPELSVAAESLHSTAEEAAERVSGELQEGAGLGPHFLETHFLELGEIALGPLLLRKSAASGARSLERAVDALDAAELQDDTRIAVSRAVRRLTEVYDNELERLGGEKNAPHRVLEERELDEDAIDRLTARAHAPFDQLAPRFRELEEKQERLKARLREVAEGPPGGEEGGLERLAGAWRDELRRLDRGFRSAWREALEEFRRAWESLLLPRLSEMAEAPRRRIPEWVQLVLLGILTFLAVGAAVLLTGGQ